MYTDIVVSGFVGGALVLLGFWGAFLAWHLFAKFILGSVSSTEIDRTD